MIRCIVALLLMNLVTASAAQAALIYRVDLDPITIGIQTSLVVQPGQQITADIVMELSGTTSIDIYGVSVLFDNSELDFRLSDSATIPLSGFEKAASLTQVGATTITGIRAATTIANIGTGPIAPQSFVIAKLKFDILAPSGDLNDFDLIPFQHDLDGSFDNYVNQLTPEFYGASITSVPEPSLYRLLAIIAPLIFNGRCRRRSMAT